MDRPKRFSHGSGSFVPDDFRRLGSGVVFEPHVLVFHPEQIEIGDDVYVGHQSILKGYHDATMIIGDGTWIGQQCFLHSAGGIVIGRDVGIGPGVQIITSYHAPTGEEERPILHRPIVFEPVEIGAGADIGAGAIVLPGARIGEGVQVGAGAVVRGSIPARATVVGVPARPLRSP